MGNIFISYHHADKRFAEALEAQLLDADFQTWRDPDLRAGESWRDAIDEAIRAAAAVVLVMSPAAKASAYLNYEWAFALGAEVKVIPLLLGLPPEQLHPRLAHSQALDFTNPLARRWDKLFLALNEATGKEHAGSRPSATVRGLPPVVARAAEALDSLVPAERIQAIETLGQMDIPAARDLLAEKGVRHAVREVRLRSAYALAKLKEPRAVPGLMEVPRVGPEDLPQGVPFIRGSDLAQIGPPAVPELIRALKDEHPGVRLHAILALDMIADDAALPGLVEALREESSQLRAAAVSALGQFGSRAPVRLVAERLGDESEDVRTRAATALGAIGDRAAVPALVERLKDDSNREVSRVAAETLTKIGGPEALAGLLEVLAHPQNAHRAIAAAALGNLKDPLAVPGLIAVLRDPDRELVVQVARALGEIGTPEGKAAAAAAMDRS